jgi:14-3-3 protein epsilon
MATGGDISHDENIYMVRLAEQTERYEDMQFYMNRQINEKKTLGEQERNLFAIAYKNLVSSRRTAWRAITALEHEQNQKGSRNVPIIQYYKAQIENEIKKYCKEILSTIEDKLLKGVRGTQTEIYYLKMQGDYYRYLSEITVGEKHKEYSGSALQKYQKAQQIAEKNQPPGLKPTAPLRLGLCLNFSVFYYEIMNNPEEAC